MKTIVFSLLLLPFLFGCIFGKDNGNQKQNVTQGPVVGLIQMADRRAGVNTVDSVQAVFAKRVSIVRSLIDSEASERGAECTSVDAESASQGKIVSVGKLLLTVGNAVIEVPWIPEQKAYGGALDPGVIWAKGQHPIKSAGSEETLAFEVNISMPALLEGVKVNGTPIAQPVSFQAQKPVEVTWNLQAETSPGDIMGVEISGNLSGKKTGFFCEIKETETNGTWEVPQYWVDKIPANLTSANFFVYRQHIGKHADGNVESVTVHGMREHKSALTVTP